MDIVHPISSPIANPIVNSIAKHIKLQTSGDVDAVNAAIALLHHLNLINGSVWSHAVRKRAEPTILRVSSRSFTVSQR